MPGQGKGGSRFGLDVSKKEEGRELGEISRGKEDQGHLFEPPKGGRS